MLKFRSKVLVVLKSNRNYYWIRFLYLFNIKVFIVNLNLYDIDFFLKKNNMKFNEIYFITNDFDVNDCFFYYKFGDCDLFTYSKVDGFFECYSASDFYNQKVNSFIIIKLMIYSIFKVYWPKCR